MYDVYYLSYCVKIKVFTDKVKRNGRMERQCDYNRSIPFHMGPLSYSFISVNFFSDLEKKY